MILTRITQIEFDFIREQRYARAASTPDPKTGDYPTDIELSRLEAKVHRDMTVEDELVSRFDLSALRFLVQQEIDRHEHIARNVHPQGELYANITERLQEMKQLFVRIGGTIT